MHRRARGICRAAVLAILLVFRAAPVTAQANLEDAIKATYLYKIAQFVEWPPDAFPPGQFTLCVIGTSPFQDLLARAAAGHKVAQAPITVRGYKAFPANLGNANPACQLMYIAGSPGQSVASVLVLAAGKPILTVTDGQTAPNAIGVINFVLVDGRVRFEIDRREAAADHLTISSKLLSVAVRILQ